MRFWGVVLIAAMGCGDDGGFDAMPSTEPPAPVYGTLSVEWRVTDGSGTEIPCETIQAQGVNLAMRNVMEVGGTSAVFACSSLRGTSQPVTVGPYIVDFELFGPGGTLATAPRQTNVIVERDRDTALAPVTFSVNAVGALDLFARASGVGANCTTTGNGGAGITGTTITLQRADGGCRPVTFTVAPGATKPGFQYTVNCASPTIAPCIEADQRITVSDVPSGPHAIHVRGKIGATDCYTNDDALAVPALGRTLSRQLALTKQALPGC